MIDRVGAPALATAALLLALPSAAAAPVGGTPHLRADGTATAADVAIPYSELASPEARALFPKIIAAGSKAPPLDGPIADSRAFYDRINSDRAARLARLYPVRTRAARIAGVGVDIVTPAAGIAPANRRHVLINLHGGAFLWGAHSGGLVESIPIASLGRIEVVSVDYREGPENTFPAASEDVEAVYRELLKDHAPTAIGIYGCSAGGALTAQAVARFLTDKLPVPGAIGTFCSSLVDLGGDSSYVGPLLNGQGVPAQRLSLTALPYFHGVDVKSPLVQPGLSAALLAGFPPTLLITGTRDGAMSSVLHSHALLVRAGVPAELHVWEGMWHSFFSDPEIPESKEAYDTIVRFFARNLHD